MASDPHGVDEDLEAESHATSITRDFHHPYTPYAIQETFMSTVYQVLDEGKIGILESPTGTVSIISRDPNVSAASGRSTQVQIRRKSNTFSGEVS
jgi:hypothetical protein